MLDEEQGFIINDLGRRLANIVRIGTILEIDFQAAKARVKIGKITTDFLPWTNTNSGQNNSWNPPEIDEQVVILSPSGELNQAIILPSLYKNNASGNADNIHSITYKDGSKIAFDHNSSTLNLDIKGDTTLNITGNTTIKVAQNAEIEATNVTLKGNVNLGGSSGQAVARVGDKVKITSGSSAGEWPITSGSSKVNAA